MGRLNVNKDDAMCWKEQLDKKGYVQLRHFLSREEANKLKKQILSAKRLKTWRLLTTPSQPLTNIKDNINSSIVDQIKHKQAVKAARNKQFAFSFFRTSNKHAKRHKIAVIHQSFANYLKETLTSDLDINGQVNDSFIAKFKPNQFIGYHTDGSAGKYAFIYQLSKGWQKKYGGQLILYPPNGRFYRKVLEPEFNCLTLLKLSHPMPHSVARLQNPPHKHRLTISGWLE